ncbi:MAG: phosphoribosylaminoimidazolesuccinocarboxamide synthase [bacterium]
MVEKLKQIYEGKAKRVYATDDEDLLIVEFKDDATAFDGAKRGKIEGKGICNNKISSILFELLQRRGIPTHFVEQIDDRNMLVKKLSILPVEVVVRNIVAGSLARRMGVEEGRALDRPVLEFYYKSDELHDPMINDYHIRSFNLATDEQVEKIKECSFKVNEILKETFGKVGIDLVDFKLEFGLHRGEVLLGDEVSPDTCRFWDSSTKRKLDKDRFRRDLGDVEDAYREVLYRLKGGAL